MAAETDPLVKTKGRECCGWTEPCCEQDGACSKSREAFWDNWRGAAQFCVVAMHCLMIGAFVSTEPQGVLWGYMGSVPGGMLLGFVNFTLVFTMPTFCFISGYFSTATPRRKQIVNQVRYSLTWFIQHSGGFALAGYSMYLSFRARWMAEHPDLDRTNAALAAQGKPALEPPDFVPLPFFAFTGVDWYLWCVVIWRCVLPLLALVERPFLLSLLIGPFAICTDAFRSVYTNAPCAFLPFFVAGFQFKTVVTEQPERFLALRQSIAAKCGFLAVMLAMIGATVWDVAKVSVHVMNPLMCLYGGELSYDKVMTEAELLTLYRSNLTERMMANNNGTAVAPPVDTFCQTSAGLFQTALFYFVSFSFIFLSISVIPGQHLPILTKSGVNSIYIYFGHVWFGQMPLFALSIALMFAGVSLPAWFATILAFIMVVAVFACLAQQWLRCVCKPCIEPDVEECCLRRERSPI